MPITTPIILAEGLDVSLHESLDAAARQLEPADVASGEFRAYDAEGRLLSISTDGVTVQVQPFEALPGHREELVTLLKEFLAAVPVDLPESERPEDLVQTSVDAGFLCKLR
jgi:hypothetical protein